MKSINTQYIELPEAILQAKLAGDFELEKQLISYKLDNVALPFILRERLKLELHNIEDYSVCYPFTYQEAEVLLQQECPDKYKEGMLKLFTIRGDVAFKYINKEVHYEARIVENALIRCPELRNYSLSAESVLRTNNMMVMKEKGKKEADITLKATLKVLDKSLLGKRAFVNLPLVKETLGITDIKILSHSDNLISIDSPDTLMRTCQFEEVLKEDTTFSITFSYHIEANYKAICPNYDFFVEKEYEKYLTEVAPHIVFTPYLKELLKEIVGEEKSLYKKAQLIYTWITSNVKYSFMPYYSLLDCISEYAALNLKGDCGVYAILFITLCRMAGIPASWQSGWYVLPEEASSHDWAQVYLGCDIGWRPVDCSFGASSFKEGNTERQQYYFGNLDIYRMVANDSCLEPLTGKAGYRWDPVDNQVGEVDVDGVGLKHTQFDTVKEVISFIKKN